MQRSANARLHIRNRETLSFWWLVSRMIKNLKIDNQLLEYKLQLKHCFNYIFLIQATFLSRPHIVSLRKRIRVEHTLSYRMT